MATKLTKKPKKEPKPKPTKAEEAKKVDIIYILDKSGSMATVWEETLIGFNKFIEDQQKAPGDATVTLVQFNNEYSVTFERVPVKDVKPLTKKTYTPIGYTALLDAIGKALVSHNAEGSPNEAIIVIQTDGQENSSREFNKEKVKELIDQGTAKGWQFVFLGAHQDAFTEAGAIGIPTGSTMTYAADRAGTMDAMASVSVALKAFRSGIAKSASFSEEDYKKQDR